MACCTVGNKNILTFIAQFVILFIVIVTSLYNLTFQTSARNDIWLVMVSTCLGAVLPGPKIRKKQQKQQNGEEGSLTNGVVQ